MNPCGPTAEADPHYVALVERVRRSVDELPAPSTRPRRLYVIHRSNGGTPATNGDLLGGLADVQESLLLEGARNGLVFVLSRYDDGRLSRIDRFEPREPVTIASERHDEYAEYVAGVLLRFGVELVHVRHLVNHPPTVLVEVCAALGVPVVFSVHDFYPVSPSVQLLDESLAYVGTTTGGDGPEYRFPIPFCAGAPRPVRGGWIHEWRRLMRRTLALADTVVVTTRSAAQILLEAYPELEGRYVVIEHGRDLDALPLARPDGRRSPGPFRIVAPAVWDEHKGIRLVRAIAHELDAEVEWHFLGVRSELLADVGIAHGPYEREDLGQVYRAIDPDLVGIFSLWPETYSHTLSEAWATGVPVVATELGAVAERVREHGGGVLVPADDAVGAARLIEAVVRDPSVIRAGAVDGAVRTVTAMVRDYGDLYHCVTVRGRSTQ